MKSNIVFLATMLILQASGQQTTGATPLEEVLRPVFFPVGNEVANVMFPPSILFAQTPIQVRYSFLYVISRREVYAACNPTALSFFGTKDVIPKSFCEKQSDFWTVITYINYHALVLDFPGEMAVLANFLLKVGLDANTESTNTSTLEGWGKIYGNRMANYFARDGWNSLGSSQYFPHVSQIPQITALEIPPMCLRPSCGFHYAGSH